MLVRATNGGNKWVVVKLNGKKQKLTDAEILKLSRLIIKIEKHYGFPCDVEWALEDCKFYILQSRPITTLNKNRVAAKAVAIHTNVQELMKTAQQFTFYRELKFTWVPISPIMLFFRCLCR